MQNQRSLAASVLMGVGGIFAVGLPLLLGPTEGLTPFDQVERSIPGGALLGLGLALRYVRPRKPLLPFLASLLGWITVGAVLGRLYGLATIGFAEPTQWMWVGLELAVIAGAALFLRWADSRENN